MLFSAYFLYFNFIMILFYFLCLLNSCFAFISFQFHYDLILLWIITFKCFLISWFQFHYDLILFKKSYEWFCSIYLISISLWSYSITILLQTILPSDATFQFHYDLILLCYKAIITLQASRFQFHYDLILFILLVSSYPPMYHYFNFIMILFYF